MRTEIDLNADLGEGFEDEAILPYVTSCNVACGGHAGDARTMEATLRAARRRGVACGAHPGYPDREGFGRRDIPMTLAELAASLKEQIGALGAAAQRTGVSLDHVKPHGALYHACSRRRDIARTVAETVAGAGLGMTLVGFAGSVLLEEGARAGLNTAGEAFADRRYLADGSLAPRGDAAAFVGSPEAAGRQALSIARDGAVLAADGSRLAIDARTICLHGDTPGAVANARAIREALERGGVGVKALRD
jgi:UPF0271 protein